MSRTGSALLLVSIAAGCGARTGVLVRDAAMPFDASARDASVSVRDASVGRDAGRDAGLDAGITDDDAGPDTMPVTAIAAGRSHTCALRGGDVYCWGDNEGGALGDGTFSDSPRPVRAAGVVDAVQVTAGSGFSCARLADATVWCWGMNQGGQLGRGEVSGVLPGGRPREARPEAVIDLTSVIDMASGAGHTCAMVSGGAIACWGGIVTGWPLARMLPFPYFPPGLSATAGLDAGDSSICAIDTDGSVRCWGDDRWFQFGVPGGTGSTWPPVEALGLEPATQVAGGSTMMMCALGSDGTVRCCPTIVGDHVEMRCSVVPGLDHVTAIAVGGAACALRDNATVLCWGANNGGEVSSDRIGRRVAEPRVIEGLPPVTAISVGGTHACAIANGFAYCWGNASDGALGDGSTAGRTTRAVRVRF